MYDHSWPFAAIHGLSLLFYTRRMQIMERGRRKETKLLHLIEWLMEFFLLNFIIDLQVLLFDVELVLMTAFPALVRSRKLSYLFMSSIDLLFSKRWVHCSFCQSPNHHERLKCYGYQPNWLVWQDPRKTQSLVQDQPKTEDSVPSISLEKCYASSWCRTVGG